MTEKEWRNSLETQPLVEKLGGVVSERKLRLFGVACCRRIERAVFPGRLEDARHAVDVAERFADGDGSPDDLLDAQWRGEFCTGSEGQPFVNILDLPKSADLSNAADATLNAVSGWEQERLNVFEDAENVPEWRKITAAEKLAQYAILSDIIGNPFRPVAVDPRWQSETVAALATGIYEERAFDRMPILADALEEAGCDHADILARCRGDGLHVRGCWVVDLVLGKE